MRKLAGAVILLILVPVFMFILNSAVLRLFYGIDVSDQLEALMSLTVAGSFPGMETEIHGGGGGQQDKGGGLHGKGAGSQAAGLQDKGAGLQNMGDTSSAADAQASAQAGDKPSVSGEDYFLTLDDIGLLENISLQDKLKAIRILSGIDREVLNSAVQMASDGITYDEYDELKESAEAYLGQADLETLEEILDRNINLYAQGGG